ncbi:MAG: VWA domain-containing protein [Phycisphaeraceae bacterium]
MLTWLQPIWLYAAGAAVLVPLAAHLLSQRGGTPVVFPTIRFLKQVVDEGRRRVRLRHWLLLLLRCLAVALLAAAFARPMWSSTFALDSAAQGLDARILLDRSASMTRTEADRPLFEIARARALTALRTLDPSRDVASVIVLDRQPRSLLPEPTANLSQLIRLVESLEPSYEHGDADAALRLLALDNTRATQDSGLRTQDLSPRREKRILIFSDLQASQWPAADAIRALLPRDAKVTIDSLGESADNLALHQPSITPAHPVIGQPALVRVELSRWSQGATSPQAVTVRLRHEGRSQVQVIRMPANTTATASFTIVPAKAGPAAIELSASSEGIDDPLAADDRAGLSVEVASSRSVAVVSGADSADSTSTTFYVMRALSPQVGAAADVPPISAITAVRWLPGELPTRLAANAPAEFIVLTEAGTLSDESLAALRTYIAQGGGVLWFIDSEDAFNAWKRWESLLDPKRADAARPAQWLPGNNAQLTDGRFTDPVLDVFAGAARSELLTTRFTAILRTARSADETLLTFEGGSPALWATWLGAGRVAVFAADIAPASSDLVKGSQFAPLLHQLVHHLSPGPPAPPAARPGEVVRVAVPEGVDTSTVIARAPDGRLLSITWETAGAQRFALLPAAKEPGIYSLIRPTSGGFDSFTGGAAISINPDESDLRTTRDATSAAAVSAASVAAAPAAASLRAHTTELWPYFLGLAAALLLFESIIVSLNPAWFARFSPRNRALEGAS